MKVFGIHRLGKPCTAQSPFGTGISDNVLEIGRRCDLAIEDAIWRDNGKTEERDFSAQWMHTFISIVQQNMSDRSR